MESLNKNWFGFTLVAVIFGILGYLLGQQGHKNCPDWFHRRTQRKVPQCGRFDLSEIRLIPCDES